MHMLSISPSSKLICSSVWLVFVLQSLLAVSTHSKDVLTVPQKVNLSTNVDTQQLFISWWGGPGTTFDILILRTELNETVFSETVSVTVDAETGQRRWSWTSAEPLECTSLSVEIRSRDGQKTSEWSKREILEGNDHNPKLKMYPQDRVVHVGDNTTFCCIVGEGLHLGTIKYANTVMNVTQLSRRSYATTRYNQGPSPSTGNNVICLNDDETELAGTVVFIGYPPLPTDLACETRDLTTPVCQWNEGRDTHLQGKKRKTHYWLNKRRCDSPPRGHNKKLKECSLERWDGSWTLVAENPLGRYSLHDSAELLHRVRPVAPVNLVSTHAWNATVHWQWQHHTYSSLALVCQVELTSQWDTINRTFSGVGLRSAVLLGLHPDEEYRGKVRCGAQQNFWRWGDWSNTFVFRTNIDLPGAPDVWMWMNGDNTGRVIWKPLTQSESHGPITGYEVTLWSLDENVQHTAAVSPNTFTVPVILTGASASSSNIIASVTAKNAAGTSQAGSVVIPPHLNDVESLAVSRVVFVDGGFPLMWQNNADASCGYVLEWVDASCLQDCTVDWTKVSAGTTNISAESVYFQPGVRYNFSLYSCSSDAPALLQRWQGYTQELVPSSSVLHLSIKQQGSDADLVWEEIPLVNRRGFVLGYNVYISNGSQLALLANLSDKGDRSYTVKGLSEGSYKFTVKAYTAAGEDTGATVSLTMEPNTDWLILEVLTSVGTMTLFLVLITFICYKKRKWVKKAFYPDIPEPKLPGDWCRSKGTLEVKPSPHSMVHIVEKPEWDSSKEVLVAIPEEDEDEEGQGRGDEPVDTDEPTSLRYYNQVVDERPIRPRFPDSSVSSASSLDSARTDVTYTGIQTSGSSLVFQLEPQDSFGVDQIQIDSPANCKGGRGGYRPQMQPGDLDQAPPQSLPEPQAAGGYQPQSSWHLDSPEETGESGGLAPSLGSPTSVASTQFLLPDGESEEHAEKCQASSSAANWFTSLLTSTKP